MAMPRVRRLATPSKAETDILIEVSGTIKALGITQAEMAKRIGIAPSTMSMRLKNISDMRLGELWAIRKERQRAGIEWGERK